MSLFTSFFGNTKREAQVITTPLELVMQTASLASNPQEIDTILDKVRAITANLEPGQDPSTEDEQTLLATYIELEAYLTTKEPIRTFTKQELRRRVSQSLLQRLPA